MMNPPASTTPPLPHLPGIAATKQWFLAAERGDVGVLEKQVSRMRDRHSRMLLHQNHPHFTGGAIHKFPTNITLQQAISDLINMQQPWTKVIGNDDPYLDEYDGGSSAMTIAAGKGHTQVVSFLLSLGCQDLGLTDAQGMSALHHTCVQGNADILKMLLISCPSRSVQLALLNARDNRALDCRKLVAVGKAEWQSGGLSAHSSGSFLRRKAYQKLLLPTVRWWKNKKDRRKKRRRLGQGISCDNAGARDFERTQNLVSFPPGPQTEPRLVGCLRPDSLATLLLASRRTRSPLSTLSNEHIWLTALEYDEEEELELGSAVAHSPLLKTSLETIDTVSKAKQLLVVLRFALNMKKGKAAIKSINQHNNNNNNNNNNEMSLLLQTRSTGAGSGNKVDANGNRISWHNQDDTAKQHQEMAWLNAEDVQSNTLRSYLTVNTLKLNQLNQLYHQLAGEEVSKMTAMSSLQFSRFAALVGEFANEEHVASILTAMPSIMRTEEFVGDCSFVNFVEFWLYSETLERKNEVVQRKNGQKGSEQMELETMDQMVAQLNTHRIDGDEEKIDWFQRLRARMRIEHTLKKPHNGDPSLLCLRKKIFNSIPMGIGIVPQSFYQVDRIVSHRKPRVSLVKFQPAKEFTQEEVIRQRRARKSNIGTGTGIQLNNAAGNEGNTGQNAAPPPIPDHLQRKKKQIVRAYDENNETEKTPEETQRNATAVAQQKKDQASAKRFADAKEAARKLEERQKEIKAKRALKLQQDEEEAKKEAELFVKKQKREKVRQKNIDRKKKKEIQDRKKQEKKVLKQQAKENSKLMRSAKKKNSKKKKNSQNGRRVVDNGMNEKKDKKGKEKKKKPEQEQEQEFTFVAVKETPVERRLRLKQLKRKEDDKRKVAEAAYEAEQAIERKKNNRARLQIKEQKNVMAYTRHKARNNALHFLNCNSENEEVGDLLKAPQDDDSVLARMQLKKKTFDIENTFETNGVKSKLEDVQKQGWVISENFKHSGYAHKKNLELIKLTPLVFVRKKKKKKKKGGR